MPRRRASTELRRPDEGSARAIRLLAALALSKDDCAGLMGEEQSAHGDWREGALLDAVYHMAADPRAARRVWRTLHLHLAAQARVFDALSVAELAELWHRERPSLRGARLAALLWSVVTRHGWEARKLEGMLAEEIEAIAFASLRAADDPLRSCSCSPG